MGGAAPGGRERGSELEKLRPDQDARDAQTDRVTEAQRQSLRAGTESETHRETETARRHPAGAHRPGDSREGVRGRHQREGERKVAP